MTALGILLFLSAVSFILYRYQAASHVRPFRAYGYAGAAILLIGEILMFAKIEPVATYFTPIAWTGYILWADAAVFSLRGQSLLCSYPAEFAWIAICSIPLWLIFEAYNLRLQNWTYVGVPIGWFGQTLGYGWSFATIWPGIFETASLLGAIGKRRRGDRGPHNPGSAMDAASVEASKPENRTGHQGNSPELTSQPANRSQEMNACRELARFEILSVVSGALLLVLPLVLPQNIRPYLFGAVWLGFLFLLDPINYRMGAESLWRDLEQGQRSRLFSLLGSGLICGIFWEFWNFWAQARWVYTFPIFPGLRVFAMPLPGYLGFPPFAVECFTLFAFLVPLINKVLEKLGAGIRFRREALRL